MNSHFCNKSILRFLVAVIIVGLSASTQAATSINPQAQRILARSIHTYQSLQTYQDSSVNVDNSPADKTVIRQAISFKAPRFLNVVTINDKYRLIDNYDGVNYNTTNIGSDGIFWTRQPLPDTSYGRHVLLQYQPAGILFTPFLAGVNPIDSPFGIAISSLKLGPTVTLDNVKVNTIIATPLDDSKTHYIYLIGQKDHLLRRVTMESVTVMGDKYTTTETHSHIKTNLTFPAGTFKFHIPPGAPLKNILEELPSDTLQKGGKAPYFHALDLHYKKINLNQYKGKVLLVDFWATWCIACRYEMPYFKSLYQKYHSQGFDIVGVSQDAQRSDLTAYVHQHRIPWRQIHDSAAAIALNYKVEGLPKTVLIDRTGKIVAVDQTSLLLDTAIRTALKK
jgi:peroxiredoxin/outer membrane lipoprotein-sorting protein